MALLAVYSDNSSTSTTIHESSVEVFTNQSLAKTEHAVLGVTTALYDGLYVCVFAHQDTAFPVLTSSFLRKSHLVLWYIFTFVACTPITPFEAGL